ncbi:PLP-dependent transferase [Biscogniauxia mediterranea]|nr:PLP-dependent transferase [Biscogniauxia mediterranea]
MGSVSQPESAFSSLKPIPYDEAFRLTKAVAEDTHPQKVSLGAGVYQDENGKFWTLPSVKKAIPLLPDIHDYLTQGGFAPFVDASRRLLFGEALSARAGDRLTSVQTVSGTGACHVGTVFLDESVRPKNAWISDPSWTNHALIWECAETSSCRPARTIRRVWTRRRSTKASPPATWTRTPGRSRHFVERGSLELCVAQSFSKNFGLYGQRVGALRVLSRDPATKLAVQSQLIRIVRSEVSTSPAFGARVVATVLGDPVLRDEWHQDLKTMSSRIKSTREALLRELKQRGTPGSWDHIVSQIGMFSYTGLNREHVKELAEKHHIYLMASGRACIAGLTPENVSRVAEAIDSVVRKSGGS